jgi:hypothetical protein
LLLCCFLDGLQVVPADLNAFLYQLERNIAWAANLTGNASTSEEFNEAAAQRKAAIQTLLWNNETGKQGSSRGFVNMAHISGCSLGGVCYTLKLGSKCGVQCGIQ